MAQCTSGSVLCSVVIFIEAALLVVQLASTAFTSVLYFFFLAAATEHLGSLHRSVSVGYVAHERKKSIAARKHQ